MQEQLTLRTNLGPTPAVKALCEGRVSSPLVKLDFCGPEVSHNGFKPMVRDQAFDAGELAIVTFLQARAYGKPWVFRCKDLKGWWENAHYDRRAGVEVPQPSGWVPWCWGCCCFGPPAWSKAPLNRPPAAGFEC